MKRFFLATFSFFKSLILIYIKKLASFKLKEVLKYLICQNIFNQTEFWKSEVRFVISVKNYTIYVSFDEIQQCLGRSASTKLTIRKSGS